MFHKAQIHRQMIQLNRLAKKVVGSDSYFEREIDLINYLSELHPWELNKLIPILLWLIFEINA